MNKMITVKREDFPFSIDDIVVCIKEHNRYSFTIKEGDKCSVDDIILSGVKYEEIRSIQIRIPNTISLTLTFYLDPNEEMYFYKYFTSPSEYRKMKINNILS